ncbi:MULTISPECIES: Uma2 family endonuclease [Okeania]|uniref:Uma2 family endonuclease n=1 Tax=Okeania hirsuta TaxID=1458930 RepID=A0A3N6PKQ6_9CYAN|nr:MULTISPECIES: Uma2 family endonuclease [Okeania]NET12440.1 Uma2 family endonuclease [Okeania sp. SIO1H6]NES76522.1 Uma2 family endonuclease [Okeania sp. SIO1H4]NES92858.1 Uma2 family endonuclease [Okeania sp. SIO2B9]NET20388.1 Uma2 family endonuclease [Okeania sp. SIO1H5]NET77022.1 Uma2 family endonuclease [Okeania sp. SIO1F9]
MSKTQTQLLTETWITATWEQYIQTLEDPSYEKAKVYYHKGKLRIEMSPLGNDHASDHTVIITAVGLFAATKNIDLNGKDNCTYRKTGYQATQPDVSYYIGENADVIPWGSSIIDLDIYPSPTLVIEVANTSLPDDKGEKRLLYEALNIAEYWIVDVQNVEIIAFAVADGGSRKIDRSQVLPGLDISLLEEALQRTRQTNQTQVYAWLLNQFQNRE